ncbi:glycosyltransferase family 31 protein [Daldinia sp. EC12]|nr:glycosyltransferase family 31 protein [Daldinia sp. EC12]
MVDQYYNSSNPCANFPDTDGILLVMKTGATETFDKMPVHLLTTMTCLPDFLIFSDMEQQVGPYHIHDALAEFDESAKAHNADFDLYRDQKECPVSQKSCVDAKRDGQKAWNLDKYKFLPMMEQTWRMRPGRDWYIFAEADTYIFWANIVHWLKNESRLNPREKLYLGSRSFIGGTPFAHGGSGYILSGTLLKHLIEYHPGVVKQYNVKGAHECCGDLMLAQALEEYEKVKIRQVWPMINGEKPSTLPYGPGHWCEPIFTMHHMNAEEISNVWQFEQTRKTDVSTRVLLIRDLYDGLIRPKMQVSRENWDNLSDDVCYLNPDPEAQQRADGHSRDRQKKGEDMNDIEKEAWKSWENCAKVCESQDRNRSCFQYRWHDEVCCTAKSFKLGAPKMPPDNGDSKAKWVSGWHLKGINDWIDAMGECKKPAWKTPEP